MPIYPGLSDASDYVREILNVAARAESEASCIDGTAGLLGELAEIQALASRALAQIEEESR